MNQYDIVETIRDSLSVQLNTILIKQRSGLELEVTPLGIWFYYSDEDKYVVEYSVPTSYGEQHETGIMEDPVIEEFDSYYDAVKYLMQVISGAVEDIIISSISNRADAEEINNA